MKDIKKACFELFLKNKRKLGKYQYTVPSPDTYPYQWLWDSCFHAIILSHFNIRDAKAEILTLLSKQFDNGLIPHMIYWDKGDIPFLCQFFRENDSSPKRWFQSGPISYSN